MKSTLLRRLALPLALAGTVVAIPAMAGNATASIDIQTLSWELIDLNPGDGLAPSVSFFDQKYHGSITYNGWFDYRYGETVDGVTQLTFPRGSSTVSAKNQALSASLTMGAQAPDNRLDADGTYDTGFYLSPYTGIIFKAATSIELNSSDPVYVSTLGMLTGRFHSNGVNARALEFSDRIERSDDGPYSYTLSGFAHAEEGGGTGYLQLYAAIRGDDTTSPVPEPASVAMLLAGLAVVGGRTLRRRQG